MELKDNIANNPTLFGKILRGEIPADKVYEDDRVLAFRDINPKTKVHVLVIPKQHIASLREVSAAEAEIMGYLMAKTADIARDLGLADDGYRVIINCGTNGGQEVPHLHVHILGGEPVGPMVCK